MMKSPAGELPLWVSLAEKGFYGFKPTICALCCLKTHDILQCPERECFPEFVEKHINMRNNSKRHWNNPYSEFYTPGWKKHLYFIWGCNQQCFEQPDVPQELSVESKISLLLESSELYIERTNQGFQIQAYDEPEEIVAGTGEKFSSHSRPGEEAAHADPIIQPEQIATQVYVPQEFFPQSLQACTKADALEGSTPAQPTKPEELHDESYKKAEIYKGKNKVLNGSPILRQKIQPIQRLWVLNTRFKSVQQIHKLLWEWPYLITKSHSHKREDIKNSTTEFKCTVQVTHYLLLPYDATKRWLTLKEQVT
ncbi:hypothetical protein FF1_025849 [Malus domestica]